MDNIGYTHFGSSEDGFARVDDVTIWTNAPSDVHTDWTWRAVRYDGDYPKGCPRHVAGIGSIEGRADSEEQALQLATAAARLIGCQPADVAHLSISSPQVTHLVAVADGPAERIEAEQ